MAPALLKAAGAGLAVALLSSTAAGRARVRANRPAWIIWTERALLLFYAVVAVLILRWWLA